MKNTNSRIQAGIKIYLAFNKSFYWLEVLIKQGLINRSEAGFIVLNYA